jgi:hypothetical protein
MIKLTAENYPISEYYKTNEMLTSLGIGEAAITALNEKGVPTPLAATLLRAPQSRMDILADDEINEIVSNSRLVPKYNETIDRESAYEMLNRKLEVSTKAEEFSLPKYETPKQSRGRPRVEKSTFEKVLTSTTTRQVGRTIAREFARGILGVLGLGGTTRRK